MSNERAKKKADMLRADRDDAPGHTPGPWSVDDTPQENGHIMILDSGDPATHDEGPAIIAELWCAERDVQRADARLIAAAPELLAALVACIDAIEDATRANTETEWARGPFVAAWDSARAAIAKAEGRA